MTRQILGAKGGGGSSFVTKPDTLRSDDSFEILLGLGSGRWKGLTEGLRSLKINGIPMENEDGTSNFDDVFAIFADGNPLEDQLVNFELGGGGSSQSVNTQLANSNASGPGGWVSAGVGTPNADFIDIRFVVQSLYKQDDKSIRENTATVEIEMRPSGSADWIDIFAGTQSSNTTYDQDGYRDEGKFGNRVLYVARKVFNPSGTGFAAAGSPLTIRGKTTSAFVKELRVAVPNEGTYANKTWEVRARLVEKDTIDQDELQERRNILFESLTAVINEPLGDHPDWDGQVWLKINGKASDQFSGFPEVEGVFDTKICQTPPTTVWDPDTRQYTGTTWDGSYEEHFTTDPAWQIKEFVEDPIHGIAGLQPGSTLDKWDALEASKYYSELVDDGRGGTHPRFSANLTINEARDVNEMMAYLAGAFNSYTEDVGGGVWRLKVDKPENPKMLFTDDNIFGEFEYSHTDVDTRFNDFRGTFLDEELDYDPNTVRVFDQDDIDENGTRFTEIALIGCTNKQEALRRLMFRMRVSLNEFKIVNFTTNRVGRYLSPLDTILVADASLNADYLVKSTSRFDSINGTTITLKRPVRLEVGISYTIRLVTTDKTTIERTVTNTSGNRGDVTEIEIDSLIAETIQPESAIAVEADGLGANPVSYRILSISRGEENEDEYTITASVIDSGKWSAMDNVSQEDLLAQESVVEIDSPTAPAAGMFNVIEYNTQYDVKRLLQVNWDRPGGQYLDAFKVEYRLNDGAWQLAAEKLKDSFFELQNPEDGTYDFKITALDRRGVISNPLVGRYTLDGTRETTPPTHLRGTLAERPIEAPYEGFRYTVTDANPQVTQVWENDQWGNEVNLVTEGSQIGVENGATVGMTAAEAAELTQQGLDITQIQQDVSDLETTYGSTASAAQSAADAAAARDAAEDYRDAAQLAQTNAETAETNAQTAETNAQTAVTAAEGARDTAITQATNASNSATSASGSATAAASSAGQASVSEGNAATSAANAAGSELAAATSAEVSVTSVALSGPETTNQDGDWFVRYNGTPATVGYTSVLFEGNYVWPVIAGNANSVVVAEKTYPAVSGRVYEVEVEFYLNSGASTVVRPVCYSVDSSGNHLTVDHAVGATLAAAGDRVTMTQRWAETADGSTRAWPAGATELRFGGSPYSGGGTVYVTPIRVREVSAEIAASAAATSASNAAVSETNAGQSATAAQTSETNAATSAANASISASQASTSETNAAGSASAASSSETNAANSASQAGTSAAAAATSASTAQTEATNSATSAAAAESSSVVAQLEGSKGGFLNQNPSFELGTQGFEGATTHILGSKPTVDSWIADTDYQGEPFVIRKDSDYGVANVRTSAVVYDRTRTYKCRFKILHSAGTFSSLRLWAIFFTSAGSYTDALIAVDNIPALNQWYEYEYTVDPSREAEVDLDAAQFVFAVSILSPSVDLRVALAYMTIEDVTESTAAETAANAAVVSASNASVSETNAGTSAGAAQTSATNAATSEANAATSASQASTSETNAAGSESSASTSAANAATSESNAGNSATAAANSESNAATSATNSATSAAAANASKVSAETAAGNASVSESNSATSETNAAGSASSAASSATLSATYRDQAQTAQTAAEAAETEATSQATISTNQATIATNAASAASSSESLAATYRDEAEQARDDVNTGINAITASVNTNSAAIATIEGAAAFTETVVAASGSDPAIVKLLAGQGGSEVSLTANAITILNPLNGDIVEVAKFSDGKAQLNNTLIRGLKVAPTAASEIFHEVQLKPLIFLASDGQVVEYQDGDDYGQDPDRIVPDTSGLPALAEGESYDIKATSVSGTQFTARVKKITAGGPVDQTSNAGTDKGSGTDPRWQTNKPTADDAYNDYYEFTFSGTIPKTSEEFFADDLGPGGYTYYWIATYSGSVTLKGKTAGGSWVTLGTAVMSGTRSSSGSSPSSNTNPSSISYSRVATVQSNQDLGTGSDHFGIQPATNTTVSAFTKVKYSTQSVSNESAVSGSIVWTVYPPVAT